MAAKGGQDDQNKGRGDVYGTFDGAFTVMNCQVCWPQTPLK